jgi:hypothetical protein
MATAFRLSCSAFGILLAVYPREFREQFRDEMMIVFAEQLRAECKSRGIMAGLAGVWRTAGWEAIRVAVPLHLRNPAFAAAVLAILVSSAITLTFFGAVTPCSMHP